MPHDDHHDHVLDGPISRADGESLMVWTEKGGDLRALAGVCPPPQVEGERVGPFELLLDFANLLARIRAVRERDTKAPAWPTIAV